MSDKQYVIRAAKMMKIDVIVPTRGCPGILGTAWINGFGKNVIDAQTCSRLTSGRSKSTPPKQPAPQ